MKSNMSNLKIKMWKTSYPEQLIKAGLFVLCVTIGVYFTLLINGVI